MMRRAAWAHLPVPEVNDQNHCSQHPQPRPTQSSQIPSNVQKQDQKNDPDETGLDPLSPDVEAKSMLSIGATKTSVIGVQE